MIIILKIIDLDGKSICLQLDGVVYSGHNYSFKWDGTNKQEIQSRNGVYLYQVTIDDKVYSGKMILNK